MRKIVYALLLLFTITGCASILKGTSEKVYFNSQPQTAKVYVNGGYVGETPQQVVLSSKENHQIEMKKEGYKTGGTVLTNDSAAKPPI